MTYIFPERGKIDKAGLFFIELKRYKIPTASFNCRILLFFSLSISEAEHVYSFHKKNFAVLTKVSDSMAKKALQNFMAIQLTIIPQLQKY